MALMDRFDNLVFQPDPNVGRVAFLRDAARNMFFFLGRRIGNSDAGSCLSFRGAAANGRHGEKD